MSRASKFKELFEVSKLEFFGDHPHGSNTKIATVGEDGTLRLDGHWHIKPEVALQLAAWIIYTFSDNPLQTAHDVFAKYEAPKP